jgi:hypothetical protein
MASKRKKAPRPTARKAKAARKQASRGARKQARRGGRKMAVRPRPAQRAFATGEPVTEAEGVKHVEMKPEHIKTLQRISAAFSRNVPLAAASSGVHDVVAAREAPRPDVPNVGPSAKGVPDGRYRVEGNDYIVTIDGGEAMLFERAQPETDPAEYILVPPATPSDPVR